LFHIPFPFSNGTTSIKTDNDIDRFTALASRWRSKGGRSDGTILHVTQSEGPVIGSTKSARDTSGSFSILGHKGNILVLGVRGVELAVFAIHDYCVSGIDPCSDGCSSIVNVGLIESGHGICHAGRFARASF